MIVHNNPITAKTNSNNNKQQNNETIIFVQDLTYTITYLQHSNKSITIIINENEQTTSCLFTVIWITMDC